MERFNTINAAQLKAAMTMTSPPLGQPGVCSQYTTERTCLDTPAAYNANCIWALPNGNPDDYEDEEDEVCRPIRCHDIETMGMGGGGLSCSHFLNGACTYYSDSSVCWETGQPRPCEYLGAWEQSLCPPNNCTWDSNSYTCRTPGEKVECGAAYQASDCTAQAGCAWEPGSDPSMCGVCYNSTKFQEVPCEAYFERDHTCCPSGRCTFVATQEDDQGFEDGRCITQGTELSCSQYDSQASCEAQTGRCVFVNTGEDFGHCLGNGEQIRCLELEEFACYTNDDCQYVTDGSEPIMDGGACIACPQGAGQCHQTPPPTPASGSGGGGGGDDGLPCNQHTAMNCPDFTYPPRCAVHFPDDDTEGAIWQCFEDAGTCDDATCDDIYSEDVCTNGCTWNSECDVCYNSSQPFPCDRCFDDSGCQTSLGCQWEAPSQGGCEDSSEGQCIRQGQNPLCKNFYEESCCPTSHCHWDESIYTCEEGGSGNQNQKPCAEYGGNTTGCPSDRCQVDHGICHDQGTTLSCTEICDEFLCSRASDCHWNPSDNDMGTCQAGAGQAVVCSTLTEDSCFEYEQCAYVEGSCTDAVCSDVYSPEVCGALSGCQWSHEECFYANEDIPCGRYWSQSDCPTDRCIYNSTCARCLDQGERCPCHSFSDEQSCPTGICYWVANTYSCEVKAQEVVPTITPGGSHNWHDCSSTLLSSTRRYLDAAKDDCQDYSGSTSATPTQIKCLKTYLDLVPISFNNACPCLYFYAQHEDPEQAGWMALDC